MTHNLSEVGNHSTYNVTVWTTRWGVAVLLFTRHYIHIFCPRSAVNRCFAAPIRSSHHIQVLPAHDVHRSNDSIQTSLMLSLSRLCSQNVHVWRGSITAPLECQLGRTFVQARVLPPRHSVNSKNTVITESKSILWQKSESLISALLLALSLLVSRVLTDYSDTTLSLDDLTFFANRFY